MPAASSRNQTQSFLLRRFAEAGIRPQARHGQNFLIDLNLVRILRDSARLGRDDVVLEVGTGTGSLTALIAERAAAVVTVEVDPQLFQLASEEVGDLPNVTLLHQDALKNKNRIDSRVMEAVQAKLDEAPGRRFKLVANLPYNIATPLVSNLLAGPLVPCSMTVTIQKELADRITARPSTKDYGALSIWVQCQCRVEIVRVMPPTVFWPRPKVHSAIIHIKVDEARRAAIADLAYFHDFTRAMFFHRRKFLRSVLASAYKGRLSKPAADEIIAQLGLAETARAEELDVATMLALADAVRARLAES
jgi:16S rRNA (adenine1518-N6/adenine1519-N6)-dimethyltransferase